MAISVLWQAHVDVRYAPDGFLFVGVNTDTLLVLHKDTLAVVHQYPFTDGVGVEVSPLARLLICVFSFAFFLFRLFPFFFVCIYRFFLHIGYLLWVIHGR